MIDQANDLRKLVMHAAVQPHDAASASVKIVLVAGGKGGVGTTTVAVNLAVAAAQHARRTVLVDADPDAPDVQNLCRLPQRYTVSDVLHARRSLLEALQPGPGGLMILPGAWAAPDLADATPACQQRLIGQLPDLAARADLVVLDGGNGLHPFTRRLWQTCHELVLVSSPESDAVLDTYAALKVAIDPARHPRVHLLVNLCPREDLAAEIHDRIRRSCRRFLGFDLTRCHWLPQDPRVVAAGRHGVPFALSQTRTPAMKSLVGLVRAFDSPEHELLFREDRHASRAWPTTRNPLNFTDRLNLGEQNADNDEDRSLQVRC
ncbi:MAG: MinD/ParA family ATP-binding protein [Thermoguttaceae bacterium]